MTRKIIVPLLAAWCSAAALAEERKSQLLPEVHGTLRSKYEFQPQAGAGRFQVTSGRFGAVSWGFSRRLCSLRSGSGAPWSLRCWFWLVLPLGRPSMVTPRS